jgi:hypothetical protein
MINIMSSILIDHPIKKVFDFVSMPENDFQWQYGTLAAASLPRKNGAAQSFYRSIGHLLGRRNLSTFEVVQYEPDEKYRFKSLSGPIHSCTSYLLESVKGGTRIHIFIQASAPHFFWITERLLETTMMQHLEENLGVLKKILETGSPAGILLVNDAHAGQVD